MAKVAYSKLGLKIAPKKELIWQGQTIEVIQYLPIADKIGMFERILNNSVDDKGYYNITLINFNIDLEIIYTYTNISFTEKQKEDALKLYDNLKGSGFLAEVKCAMAPEELKEIEKTIYDMINNLYEYHRSALGVLQAMSEDYNNLNFDIDNIKQELVDIKQDGVLQDVMTKMG